MHKKRKVLETQGFQALFFGALGATRTRGLQSRSLTLYPTELRAHGFQLESLIILSQAGWNVKPFRCFFQKEFQMVFSERVPVKEREG